MFLLGNQVLNIDQAFTGLDGTSYPSNWLRLTTLEEKEAIGITEAADPVRPDDRFYWVDGNGIGTPRDLDALKADWAKKVNEIAYSMLAPTDWYVVRKAESGADIPADVSAHRAAIRSAANSNQTALNNAADFDTFMQEAQSMTWPQIDGGQ
jgi:hypothetical protein